MAAAAVVVLVAGARYVDLSTLHLTSWNDQINFISAARSFLLSGRVESTVVYPGTLTEGVTTNFLYMFGYPLLLALSYRIGGYGVLTSFLPSLLAFVIGAPLLFLLGERTVGRRSGLVAAGLYLGFPAFIHFAFVAMPEMVVVTTSLLALTGFVALPPRLRPLGGPVLVAMAVAFRETGIFLALPMGILLLAAPDRRRFREIALFAALTVGAAWLVLRSPLAAGRPGGFPPPQARLTLFGQDLYHDVPEEPFRPTPSQWRTAVARRVAANAEQIRGLTRSERPILAVVALGAFLALVGSVRRGPSRAAHLAMLSLFAATLAVVLLAYEVQIFRGVRLTLVTAPLALLAIGDALARGAARCPRSVRPGLAVFTAGVLLYGACRETRSLLRSFLDGRHFAHEARALANLERTGHDDTTMLVAPVDDGLFVYAARHFPVQVSFAPASAAALERLERRLRIGTAVLPDPSPEIPIFEAAGFSIVQRFVFEGRPLLLLRRPGLPPAAPS